MKQRKYYYTTRDLLLMAALAALGGIASTYINFIGDFFQSVLGFAGTTQWAAGLHVLWLVLAVGLTKKQGAGTITGILKGAVELFTGNTHGLLVLLVNIVAGLMVDLGMLPFRKRDHWLPYAFAGGIASASNIFVFQLFTAVPADILTYGVIGLIALVAFVSGVIFAGILGFALLSTLRRSGVVKNQESQPLGRNTLRILLAGAVLLAGGIFGYLKIARSGTGSVAITGAVSSPYEFTAGKDALQEEKVEFMQGGVTVSYRGYSLQRILEVAEPDPDANYITFEASDGYTFYISAEELSGNSNLILQSQGKGENQVYNIVGPESNKAWVNGVVKINVVKAGALLIKNNREELIFNASSWTQEMDSTTLDAGYGSKKYQGVPLRLVLGSMSLPANFTEVVFNSKGGDQAVLSVEQVWSDDGIRIFIILDKGTITYIIAHLDGEVYLPEVERIILQ